MSNLFLKPRTIDGAPAIVRDPHTLAPLPAEGAHKADSDYWRRRLRDGDVVEADPVDAPVEAAVEEPTRKNARERRA